MLVVTAASLSCVQPSEFDPLEGGAASSESETASFVPDPPAFIDPSDGIERIRSDRREPLDLRVRGIRPGATLVLLDGVSLGTLQADAAQPPADDPSVPGTLTEARLQLRFSGAMTVGVHALELFNAGDVEGRPSVPVALEVEGAPTLALDASVDTAPMAPALDLWRVGQGAQAHLAWLEQGPGASLRVAIAPVRPATGDFDFSSARRFALPGLDASLLSSLAQHGPVVAVHASEDGVRLAWPVGSAGTRIDWAYYRAPPTSPITSPTASGTALTSDHALFSGREWTQLLRPHFVDRQLVVEVVAPADVEARLPGDHQLVSLDWRGDAPGGAVRVGVTDQRDLEGLAPLFDLHAATDAQAALVRVAGAWLRGVEAGPEGPGLRFFDRAATHVTPVSALEIRAGAVGGALASRSTFSAEADGTARVIFEARFARRASTLVVADALPNTLPRGEVSAGVVAGQPVFALAYGASEALRIASTNGDRLVVDAASVACDRVVLSPTQVAQATAAGTDDYVLPMVCLVEGELRVGEVRGR